MADLSEPDWPALIQRLTDRLWDNDLATLGKHDIRRQITEILSPLGQSESRCGKH